MCVYVFVVDDNVRTILSEKYVIGVSDYFKLWLILHIFVEYLANYKISTKSRFYIVFCHLLQYFRELIILQSRVATVHSSHHAIICDSSRRYRILYLVGSVLLQCRRRFDKSIFGFVICWLLVGEFVCPRVFFVFVVSF